MRRTVLFNDNWLFTQGNNTISVCLPHTWNAKDGTDGGNDYWRGTCWYRKSFYRPEMTDEEELWVEFRGVAMSAEVYLNGKLLAVHDGGYSAFRINLTDHLADKNELTVSVDNGVNRRVYPQKADFTFYGGIYRDAYLIQVPKEHFELGYYGTPGIKVTSELNESLSEAEVQVKTWHNAKQVAITVNGETRIVKDTAIFTIHQPRLWDGKLDPYLYTATAKLESGDEISATFGIRKIAFDPDTGFWLNNKNLRLVGAARHQDRERLGNALTEKQHQEDISILLEMGCNTVRLAHYQQDQTVYDLCDRYGLIVWAEIPYITEHMEEGKDNTISQMTELIVQCCNHPSIVCWGLSNEITATGGSSEQIVENHRLLNELCHRLDPTRFTTMAHVFMLSMDEPLVMLPDIRSYNLYYGWYLGELDQNDRFFDEFHAKYPSAVIGLSEYGADANPKYQAADPEKGDWTEGYQALYHEHLLRMWSERPYIWAMHCWNGFDFGADGRDEGGKPGQNQKGLVTFDRKIRKDAFYIYKAYLSDEPFIHICGRRYADRTEQETEIKVYTNQKSIVLFVDGIQFAEQSGDKILRFTVPIHGEHEIKAVSGDLSDCIHIRHVDAPNGEYIKDGRRVINWFDREDEIIRPGFFSIKDSMADVKADLAAKKVFDDLVGPLQEKLIAAYGDVAKNVEMSPQMQAIMDKMSVEATLKQMGKLVTPEFVHQLNHALNQIEK